MRRNTVHSATEATAIHYRFYMLSEVRNCTEMNSCPVPSVQHGSWITVIMCTHRCRICSCKFWRVCVTDDISSFLDVMDGHTAAMSARLSSFPQYSRKTNRFGQTVLIHCRKAANKFSNALLVHVFWHRQTVMAQFCFYRMSICEGGLVSGNSVCPSVCHTCRLWQI